MAESRTPKIQFFWISGLRVRAAVYAQEGAGVPLLLFNGIGVNFEVLQPFIEQLENTTVVCYDVPGSGGSHAPRYPWRPSKHVELAATVLDRLGIGKVNVLGISWGGMLAQQFARQYSLRTERLVLAATSAGQIMIPARLSVLLKMSNPMRYFSKEYMHKIAPDIYGGSLRINELHVKQHASRIKPPSSKGYYFQLLTLLGWSSLPWLHKLTQPTLIMAGNDDPIVPMLNAQVLHACIPNSELKVVDCGHLFLLTQAETLAPEIERFFASHLST